MLYITSHAQVATDMYSTALQAPGAGAPRLFRHGTMAVLNGGGCKH